MIDQQNTPDSWVDLWRVVVVLRWVPGIPVVAKVGLDLFVVPPKSLELLGVFQVVPPVESPAASPVSEVLDVAAKGLGHPAKLGDDLGFYLEDREPPGLGRDVGALFLVVLLVVIRFLLVDVLVVMDMVGVCVVDLCNNFQSNLTNIMKKMLLKKLHYRVENETSNRSFD